MLTIISPNTGKRIQIAEEDTVSMQWLEAKLTFENLGNGWRIPTIEELKTIYDSVYVIVLKENDNKKYNLYKFGALYWSITEFDADHAWTYYFDEGYAHESSKDNWQRVRAVRDL